MGCGAQSARRGALRRISVSPPRPAQERVASPARAQHDSAMRASTLVAVFAVVAASQGVAGCKSEKDEEAILLPSPPAASIVPSAVATGPAPVVPQPIAPVPAVKTPAPVGAGTKADAGAPVADAGAGATTDAGTTGGVLSGKLAACASKCQGILQSCLTPAFPADGGFPQIKDPKACQTAFETCSTGCVP